MGTLLQEETLVGPLPVVVTNFSFFTIHNLTKYNLNTTTITHGQGPTIIKLKIMIILEKWFPFVRERAHS